MVAEVAGPSSDAMSSLFKSGISPPKRGPALPPLASALPNPVEVTPPRQSKRRGSIQATGPVLRFAETEPEDTFEVTSPSPTTSRTVSHHRTNHLGIPEPSKIVTKIKFCRNVTVVYGADQVSQQARAKVYSQIVRDVSKFADLTIAGLTKLLEMFVSQSVPSNTLRSAAQFREALSLHGVKDRVLIQRMFAYFVDESKTKVTAQINMIDYRDFCFSLLTATDEPLSAKVTLLFQLYDVDQSGTLALNELTSIFTRNLPPSDTDRISHEIEVTWEEIRSRHEGVDDLLSTEAAGIKREQLLDAIESLPPVRSFFSSVLTKSTQAAVVHQKSFESRLAELKKMQRPTSSPAGSPNSSPTRRSTGGEASPAPARPNKVQLPGAPQARGVQRSASGRTVKTSASAPLLMFPNIKQLKGAPSAPSASRSASPVRKRMGSFVARPPNKAGARNRVMELYAMRQQAEMALMM